MCIIPGRRCEGILKIVNIRPYGAQAHKRNSDKAFLSMISPLAWRLLCVSCTRHCALDDTENREHTLSNQHKNCKHTHTKKLEDWYRENLRATRVGWVRVVVGLRVRGGWNTMHFATGNLVLFNFAACMDVYFCFDGFVTSWRACALLLLGYFGSLRYTSQTYSTHAQKTMMGSNSRGVWVYAYVFVHCVFAILCFVKIDYGIISCCKTRVAYGIYGVINWIPCICRRKFNYRLNQIYGQIYCALTNPYNNIAYMGWILIYNTQTLTTRVHVVFTGRLFPPGDTFIRCPWSKLKSHFHFWSYRDCLADGS